MYSRNEHETGDEWVIMTMIYWDRYERIRGEWYFRRRLPLYWYATDLNKPPIGANKMRWPDRDAYEGGYHAFFPTWDAFWNGDADVAAPRAGEGFLEGLRRGAEETLSVRVR